MTDEKRNRIFKAILVIMEREELTVAQSIKFFSSAISAMIDAMDDEEDE